VTDIDRLAVLLGLLVAVVALNLAFYDTAVRCAQCPSAYRAANKFTRTRK